MIQCQGKARVLQDQPRPAVPFNIQQMNAQRYNRISASSILFFSSDRPKMTAMADRRLQGGLREMDPRLEKDILGTSGMLKIMASHVLDPSPRLREDLRPNWELLLVFSCQLR